MELSNFEVWEKWLMLLGSFLIAGIVVWKTDTTTNSEWYSEQMDNMWKKIDAGLEVRPSRYLR